MLIRQLSSGQSPYKDSRYGESRIALTVRLSSNAYQYPRYDLLLPRLV